MNHECVAPEEQQQYFSSFQKESPKRFLSFESPSAVFLPEIFYQNVSAHHQKKNPRSSSSSFSSFAAVLALFILLRSADQIKTSLKKHPRASACGTTNASCFSQRFVHKKEREGERERGKLLRGNRCTFGSIQIFSQHMLEVCFFFLGCKT